MSISKMQKWFVWSIFWIFWGLYSNWNVKWQAIFWTPVIAVFGCFLEVCVVPHPSNENWTLDGADSWISWCEADRFQTGHILGQTAHNSLFTYRIHCHHTLGRATCTQAMGSVRVRVVNAQTPVNKKISKVQWCLYLRWIRVTDTVGKHGEPQNCKGGGFGFSNLPGFRQTPPRNSNTNFSVSFWRRVRRLWRRVSRENHESWYVLPYLSNVIRVTTWGYSVYWKCVYLD